MACGISFDPRARGVGLGAVGGQVKKGLVLLQRRGGGWGLGGREERGGQPRSFQNKDQKRGG